MSDDVTLKRRLSLAGRIYKMIPEPKTQNEYICLITTEAANLSRKKSMIYKIWQISKTETRKW